MPVRRMGRRRVWMVQGLIAGWIGSTGIAFLCREPLWPIVYYPMFSHARSSNDATSLEVYVVGADGESLLPREAGTFFRDFDGVGVQIAVTRIATASGPDSEASRRFLAFLLEALQRNAGAHDDATPTALRLYRVVWHFSDAPTPRRHAAARTLLAEVTRDASR